MNRRNRATFSALLLAAIAPPGLFAQAPHSGGTKYYVSSVSGNDRNSGRTPEQAWATAGKLNAVWAAGGIHPCDTVAIDKAGDLRDDYLKIINPTIATPATPTTTPLPSSGIAGCPITVTSYGTGNGGIDAADIITGAKWMPVRNMPGVYETTLAQHPGKLFVDPNDTDTPQLMPQTNAVGEFVFARTYNEYDLVTDGPIQYMRNIGVAPITNVQDKDQTFWVRVDNPAVSHDSQHFSNSNSGLQNVAQMPGSWYITPSGSAWTVFVHLRDGTDPAAHIIEATHRDYGAYLASVDYVTITGLKIEHAMNSCIAAIAVADSTKGSQYFTNEYNQFTHNTIFNCGNVGHVQLPLQTRVNVLMAGLLVRPGGETDPHLLRGISSSYNNVGTIDTYYGMRGAVRSSGIYLAGIDGGGTANSLVSYRDVIHTTNEGGLIYTNYGLSTKQLNSGGRIAFDEIYNSVVNLAFGATAGGQVDHMYIHDSKGQGLQIGGPSTSSAAVPFIAAFNVFANIGVHPSTVGFNAIDCNGATDGLFKVYEINNTIFNTPDAGATFEAGCSGSTFINNITDQDAEITQKGKNVWTYTGTGTQNGSYLLYFIATAHSPDVHWSNNAWREHDNHTPPGPNAGGKKFSGVYDCTSFETGWPSPHQICSDIDPMFVNARGGSNTANDFRLQPNSPMRGAGIVFKIGNVTSSTDLGAVPYGSKFPF